jgi:anti-anti-sigma factor
MVRMDASILRVNLEEDFTIYQVEELTKELVKSFLTAEEVHIDLTQTDKIDTAGFQLIVSLKKSCAELGKKFEAVGISDSVENFINLYGYEFKAEQKGDI